MLTPQGKVVDLPKGATPVDFAYAVHTDLGHRTRGAKIEGRMVPLDTPLANGQRVEIVATKQGGPSRDWLNPALNYVTTHRARAKVRQWFKAQQHDETVAQGRALVERELARAGATAVNLDAVAAKAGFPRLDDFFAAATRDELNLRQIQAAIRAVVEGTSAAAPAAEAPPEVTMRSSRAKGAGSGILIVGVDRLMTGLARCCKPAPPDPIVGFVTRGKGITIHRASCANVARIREREPERLIESDWGARRDEVFPVDIVVECGDRQGLLKDISEVFSREKINVTAVNTLTKHHLARMNFVIEVEGVAQLKRALALVRDVPGVLAAGRRSTGLKPVAGNAARAGLRSSSDAEAGTARQVAHARDGSRQAVAGEREEERRLVDLVLQHEEAVHRRAGGEARRVAHGAGRVVRRAGGAVRRGERPDLHHGGDAADVLHVGHHDVVGAGVEPARERRRRGQLLQPGEPHAHRVRVPAQCAQVVDVRGRFRQRALEPGHAQGRQRVDRAPRGGRREAPVAVDVEFGVGTDRVAHRRDAFDRDFDQRAARPATRRCPASRRRTARS